MALHVLAAKVGGGPTNTQLGLLLAERKDKVGLNKHGKVVMSGLSVQAYIWEKEEGSAELEIYIIIGTILVHLLVK